MEMSAEQADRSAPWLAPIDWLWRGLAQPFFTLLMAIVLLATLIVARLLPQMPAQLASDPGEMQRWLAAASDAYGAFGPVMRMLSFFDLLHSLGWRILVLLFALGLAIQWVEQVLAWRRSVLLEAALAAPNGAPGEPLTIASPLPLHRCRFLSAQAPAVTLAQIELWLSRHFPVFKRQASAAVAEDAAVQALRPQGLHRSSEERILAWRNLSSLRWQPLLSLGGLLAALTLWLGNVYGWRIETEALAPLGTFFDEAHAVRVEYHLQNEAPVLAVYINELLTQFVMQPKAWLLQTADNGITVRSDQPALLVQSLSPSALLERPGQTPSDRLGVIFPSVGSEESILLPNQNAGLRVVRGAGEFTVEVIGSDDRPLQRFTVSDETLQTLQFGGSEQDGQTVEKIDMRFLLMPAPIVEVANRPLGWLGWPALLLALAGFVGFWRAPRFILLQIAPWPLERSLVVAQSDDKTLVEALETTVGGR